METNNKYSAAIDIGSTKVIVLVGEKSKEGRIRIVAGAVSPLRDGTVSRGVIRDIKDVTTAIKDCVDTIEKEDLITITEAVISVTGQHVYCKNHKEEIYVKEPDEISEYDINTLKDNAWRSNNDTNFFIMDVLPINYTIDNGAEEMHPLGKRGNRLHGNYNILYGDKRKIEFMRRAIEEAGISEVSLIPFASASAEAVLTEDDKFLGVALVDFGSTTTEVTIYCNGVIRFMFALPYGSSLINNDIRHYGVIPRAVETLKVKYGCAVTEAVDSNLVIEIPTNTAALCKPIPARTLSRIIEARIVEIGKGIKEMISLSGYSTIINNGIVLTGGGSKLKHIDRQLSRVTNLGVRLGIPDYKVDGIDNDTIYDAGYATSIGTLISSLNKGEYCKIKIQEEVKEEEKIEEVVGKKDSDEKSKKEERGKETFRRTKKGKLKDKDKVLYKEKESVSFFYRLFGAIIDGKK